MAAPEPLSFEDIPDPAAAVAGRAVPAPAIPAEPSPTRPERRRRLLVALAIAAAWVAAVTAGAGVRHDIGRAGVLVELALWIGAALAAVAIALHPGSRGLSLGGRVLATATWTVPALFVATALAWSASAPPLGDVWGSLGACLGLCTLLGVVPMAVACLMFRGAFPVLAPWRLALLGAVAGLSGSIGCQAHCPIGAATHVILAHGLPIVLGALVGAAWGALRGRA